MAIYKLNIERIESRTYIVTVPINKRNKHIALNFSYNIRGGFWKVAISDTATGEELVSNAPLVMANGGNDAYSLMVQFDYMNIGQLKIMPMNQQSNETHPKLKSFENNYYFAWEV